MEVSGVEDNIAHKVTPSVEAPATLSNLSWRNIVLNSMSLPGEELQFEGSGVDVSDSIVLQIVVACLLRYLQVIPGFGFIVEKRN